MVLGGILFDWESRGKKFGPKISLSPFLRGLVNPLRLNAGNWFFDFILNPRKAFFQNNLISKLIFYLKVDF